VRVVKRTGQMRFANGTALLNHHFIKLGFLNAWKELGPGDRSVSAAASQTRRGSQSELRLPIPMAYIEAVAV
jgi:arsenite methyltransferase